MNLQCHPKYHYCQLNRQENDDTGKYDFDNYQKTNMENYKMQLIHTKC